MHEEKSAIDAKFSMVRNYFKTWKNIYRACYDMLNAHVNIAAEVAPPTTPPTTGWNATISLCDIFNQLATTYGKPTPDTMRQSNLTFLAGYNPQDSPEILFKQCTDCQEIATLAQNLYTTQELLQNSLDLIAQCSLYQRDIEDWERKPICNQTWINLCPFIQEAYQRCLTSGMITSTQSGYTQSNLFTSLATNKDSDNDIKDTIAGTINSHMASLTAQTMATRNKHPAQRNVSLQQLAASNAQLHQQQQAIINQMAMMSLGGAHQGATAVVTMQQTAHAPPQLYLPLALSHHQQGYYYAPQQFGGCGCTAG